MGCLLYTSTVISRLIEGEFLDYKRVIPEGFKTRVTVDVRDFVNTIERASLITVSYTHL